MSLKGKRALVTGSTTGIGRAIACEFARQGACVLVHGRSDSQNSQAVVALLQDLGVEAGSIFQDFSQLFDYEDFVAKAFDQFGEIDIWVNNAGADVLTGELSELSLEEKLAHLHRVDVAASLFLSRAAGQRMKQAHKPNGTQTILNVGWDQAWQGMAGESGELFSTTKGAIMAMTKSLAQSLAPSVRVNCLAPGWIQTQWGEGASEYWDQRARSESLMDRWGTPKDVAKTAAFLASDAASFLSGQIVNVNGGFNFEGNHGSA